MVAKVLPEIPLFEGLDLVQRDQLNEWIERREVEPGVEIIREGTPPEGLYVLAKGSVAVIKKTPRGDLKIAELVGPTVFGEMGLLSKEPCAATVRTETKAILGWLPVGQFDREIERDNITALRIAFNLGCIALHRLRATLDKIADLSEAATSEAATPEGLTNITRRLDDLRIRAIGEGEPM